MSRTALIAGATGLVGGHCLRALLESSDFARLIVLTRRPLSLLMQNATSDAVSKVEQRTVDFDRFTPCDCAGAEVVFCALGTTMAKAASKEAFRRVDYGYVKTLAEASLAVGARQFVLVSSTGANPASVNFYARVKGDAEDAVAKLPFQAVHILRPSLLLGERTESRPLEAMGRAVMPLFNPLLLGSARKYRAIKAETVGRAMVSIATRTGRGVQIYYYDQIRGLAGL